MLINSEKKEKCYTFLGSHVYNSIKTGNWLKFLTQKPKQRHVERGTVTFFSTTKNLILLRLCRMFKHSNYCWLVAAQFSC